MKILHIDLKLVGKDNAEFCYFWDNSAQYKSREFPLAQIAGLIDRAETDYYTRLPEEYAKTGQALYNWLDGSDRLLADALNQNHHEGLILAISTDKGLAHLPWELLHDGESFLVEKMPPIIPLRWMKKQKKTIEIIDSPQNRPLNLLFMATSPLGVEPVLDHEAEEGQILEATKRIPLNLRVEESGCLQELVHLVQEYHKNHFDVFHLTGHATHKDQKPCFLTEDEYGNCVYSNSRDIANTFKKRPLPSLIFLSGCRTGYGSDDDIPSMAEELLHMGAKAVLGWGGKVLDTDASTASSTIYGELSAGKTITEALASTYEALINKNSRDWHKLRLYVANILPGALVTPLRTEERKQLPKPTISLEFRDDEGHLRVVSPENFVGRRRQLQNCLRTLKTDREKVGVLLHGMGGLGKSSIASRLWDRLPDFEKILWWRQIDEAYLIRKLQDKLIKPSQINFIPYLENSQVPLKSRLKYLFSQLAEMAERPFLFIFDDFEWNLEPREGRYIFKSEVFPILAALISAIREKGTEHRIIITCRYRFDSELLDDFYEQGLESLKKAELAKKLSRLEHFNSQKIPEDLRERALTLAAGNPRLLEFLNDEVLGEKDAQAKLIKLEQSPELWKDKIIWKELYQEIDEPLQQILSYCLIYEIPVPMEALEVVCESLPNYQQQLNRGLCLGLIEPNPQKEYQVSLILPHIISTIKLPQDEKNLSKLSGKAVQKLSQLWGKKENENLEKWQEIFRLAFADKENQDRFREQFSKVIEVQYNHGQADEAYQIELKKVVNELSQEHLYNPYSVLVLKK
jgi:CHAT domain-containing protein